MDAQTSLPQAPDMAGVMPGHDMRTVPLGRFLLENGKISIEQLNEALEEQCATDEKLGDILVRNRYCTRQDVNWAYSVINPEMLHGQPVIQDIIPDEVLLDNYIDLRAVTANEIHYGTLEAPEKAERILRQYVPKDISLKLVDGLDYMELGSRFQILKRKVSRQGLDLINETDPSFIMQEVIEEAVLQRASDIYIVARDASVQIRFKKDGIKELYTKLPNRDGLASALMTHLKDRANMDLSQRNKGLDGSFSSFLAGRSIDFRASWIPLFGGSRMVLRVLDGEISLMPLLQLGMPPAVMKPWKDIMQLPSGLVLVTGSTGHGKSTTLYATIQNVIDVFGRDVITVEEPVEYVVPDLAQINVTAQMSFDSVQPLLLRQAPDILVIGEIRDDASARAAVRLAETGHLVLATMHTNDVETTVGRLKHFSVDTDPLRQTLRGILSQRLVRTLCKNCHGTRTGPDGKACKVCRTGYLGLTGHYEFLDLRKHGIFDKVFESGKLDGVPLYSFAQDKRRLLAEKITDEDEFKRVSIDVEEDWKEYKEAYAMADGAGLGKDYTDKELEATMQALLDPAEERETADGFDDDPALQFAGAGETHSNGGNGKGNGNAPSVPKHEPDQTSAPASPAASATGNDEAKPSGEPTKVAGEADPEREGAQHELDGNERQESEAGQEAHVKETGEARESGDENGLPETEIAQDAAKAAREAEIRAALDEETREKGLDELTAMLEEHEAIASQAMAETLELEHRLEDAKGRSQALDVKCGILREKVEELQAQVPSKAVIQVIKDVGGLKNEVGNIKSDLGDMKKMLELLVRNSLNKD